MTVPVTIGGTSLQINTGDPVFADMLHRRYGNFADAANGDPIALEVEIADPREEEAELSVTNDVSLWTIARGDFHATYNTHTRRGHVRQTRNPWSIDTLIRIVHSLELATAGGFLLHAASAVLNNEAFVFTGTSGAGKTTISSLAPAHARLLTDEISYLRPAGGRFLAWGTPFAGELGIPGPNISAPVKALYCLEHAPENRITRLSPPQSLRTLLTNILFFANDVSLIESVFETAARFVESVDVFRLAFKPDHTVWNLIQ